MSEFKISNSNKSIIKMFQKDNILIVYVILIAIFIGILIASVIAFYAFHRNSDVIDSGIYIKGNNISGLTKAQAIILIEEDLKNQMSDHIILKYKNHEYYVAVEQIEAEFDIESSVDFAYKMSRTGNMLKDIQRYISILISNIDIEPILQYNEQALTKYIENIQANLPDQLQQSGYYIDDDKLIITNGVNGAGIYMEKLKTDIIEAIQDISYSRSYIDIPTYIKYPDAIDVDSVHEDIYRQAKNAYFTTEPYAVYAHVIGVDFNVDNLKSLIEAEDLEEYSANLQYTIPDITTNDIGMEAFPDLLGTYTTSYVTTNTDRTTNLILASNKINGVVIMPGETFSYNKIVGKRTIDAGYKEAAIYSDGQVTSGLGGGICQISSTLYNSVIFADLEIASRRNHMFIPSYVTGGRDATVVWGSTDFKFKNPRDYPIKISSKVGGGRVIVDIYGLKRDEEYNISIETETVKTIAYKTEYQKNSRYKSGDIIQSGHNGSVVDSYKIYRLNGEVIKKEKLSRDTYSAMNKIIAK